MNKEISNLQFMGGGINLSELLDQIRNTSGTNDKIKLINDYAHELRYVLYFCYNPYMKYGLTRKTIEKAMSVVDDNLIAHEYKGKMLVDLFNELSRSNMNDETRYNIAKLLSDYTPENKEILIGILIKDLRLGVNVAGINKAIPNLIPTFKIQNGHPYDKSPIKEGEWFSLTQKLNGVRGVLVNGIFYSKQGKVIGGLDHIISSIDNNYISKLRHFSLYDLVFDGELVYDLDDVEDDNDRLRKTISIINSDSPHKGNVKYHIFAIINKDDFDEGESRYPHADMTSMLNDIQTKICDVKDVPFACVKTLYAGTDQTKIEEYLKLYDSMGLEGIMLNKDVPYKCKRHTGCLKVKMFYNMDLTITGLEEGEGKYKGMLGAFVVDYKGNSLKIGSGFSDAQRKEYWNDGFIGRIIEIQYKEESKNKNEENSLQFATFVRLREEGKEVSYG